MNEIDNEPACRRNFSFEWSDSAWGCFLLGRRLPENIHEIDRVGVSTQNLIIDDVHHVFSLIKARRSYVVLSILTRTHRTWGVLCVDPPGTSISLDSWILRWPITHFGSSGQTASYALGIGAVDYVRRIRRLLMGHRRRQWLRRIIHLFVEINVVSVAPETGDLSLELDRGSWASPWCLITSGLHYRTWWLCPRRCRTSPAKPGPPFSGRKFRLPIFPMVFASLPSNAFSRYFLSKKGRNF